MTTQSPRLHLGPRPASRIAKRAAYQRGRTLPAPWRKAVHLFGQISDYPPLSVALSVAGFAFLGPLAALVLVATLLDHEFAHGAVMRRLGYDPGPVRLVPLLGAFVRAGRPMLRSGDIAIIYLAGPLAGILSAAGAAALASWLLTAALLHQVLLGAAGAVGLNLFNLLPFEPLDGGLISRALPYPTLLLFPVLLAGGLATAHLLATPVGMGVLAVGALAACGKVRKWRRYVAGLRRRMDEGDATGLLEWQATFHVPWKVRILVVGAYAATLGGGTMLLVALLRALHLAL
jgi:Zn-dependent protease